MSEILPQRETSVLHQLAALVVSLLAFVVIWFIAGLLLTFLQQPSGPIFDWLHSAFRDVFAPWVGGYAGLMLALGWFSKSTAKFVFIGFSVVILLLIGAYLGMVGMMRTEAGITVGSYLWAAATLVAGVIGAFKAASENGFQL